MSEQNFSGLYDNDIKGEPKAKSNIYDATLRLADSFASKPKFGTTQTLSMYNPLYQNQYKPRYEAAMAYDKLGYNPYRDNEAIYNQQMSFADKFQRAGGQMLKIAGAAALDQLTFGASSKATAEKFAEANAIGGSTEDTLSGKFMNQMVNMGFTLGIAGEFALESILLSFVPYAGEAAMAAKYGKAADALRRAKNITEATRKQRSIVDAMDGMVKSTKLSEFASKAASFVNPLENTSSFIKDLNTARNVGLEFSRGEKIAKGTTALWRDVQATRAVYTEAKLEGNFAQKDMEDKWLMDYQALHGHGPSEAEAKDFHEHALAANYATSMVNMPLIFLTNKITLAPLFRPLEKTIAGDVLGSGARRVYMDISKNGVRTIKQLPKARLDRLKMLAKNAPGKLVKGSALYFGENFMEGFQEVAQEIASGTAKEYYQDMFDNNLRGSWYDYMMSNAANQVSKQGLETFASGALMQMFVSPILHGVGYAGKNFTGDRSTPIGRLYDKIDDRRHKDDADYLKKKKETRELADKKFNQDIEDINFLFENAAYYFNGNYEQLAKSKKFQDEFGVKDFDAMSDSEKQKYVNSVHERMNEFVTNSIQRGYFDELKNQFNDMSKFIKNSKDDMIKDIGQEQVDAIEKNVDAFIKKADQIKEDYDFITGKFKKPFSDDEIKKSLYSSGGITSFNNMIYANKAYEKAVGDYIFAKDNLKLGLQKQLELDTEMKKVFNESGSRIAWSDISLLYDVYGVKNKLDNVRGILYGINGGNGLASTKESERTPEMSEQIRSLELQEMELEKIYKLMTEYTKDTKTEIAENKSKKEVEKTEKEKQNEKTELGKAVRTYLQSVDANANMGIAQNRAATYNSLANMIVDYAEMSRMNNINNQSIEYLTDPSIWQENLKYIASAVKHVHEQRDREIESSIQKAKENTDNDALVAELANIGLACDDINEVRKSKMMPKKLLDINTNQEIGYLDDRYAKGMEIIKRFIPDLIDMPIPETKYDFSVGSNLVDNKTIEQFKGLGLEVGKEYSVETAVKIFTEKTPTLYGESKGDTSRITLANTLLQLDKVKKLKVKIVNDASTPVSFDSNTITLDLRYFSPEYKGHSDYSFALMKGIVGVLTIDAVQDENSDFYKSMSKLFEKAKKHFEENSDKLSKDRFLEMKGLDSLQDFVIESLTNIRFQKFLAGIKFENAKTSYERNGFSQFVSFVKELLKKYINKGDSEILLNESLSVITDYITDGETITEGQVEENKLDISYSDFNADRLTISLDDNEKSVIVNTFLLLKDNERNGRSNDEIIHSPEFETFWNNPAYSFMIQGFVNSHNTSIDSPVNQQKVTLGRVDLRSVPVFQGEEVEYKNTKHVKQYRLAVMAVKLVEGHEDILNGSKNIEEESNLFSDTEIDIWNNNPVAKKKIIQIAEEIKGNKGKKFSFDEIRGFIDKLKSLGYSEGELLKLKRTPIILANLSAYSIPFSDYQLLGTSARKSDVIKQANDLIIKDLNKCGTEAEVMQWELTAANFISNIPKEVVPAQLSIYEIRRLADRKRSELTEGTVTENIQPVKVHDIILYKDEEWEVTSVDDNSISVERFDSDNQAVVYHTISREEDFEVIPQEDEEEFPTETHDEETSSTVVPESAKTEVINDVENISDFQEFEVNLADKIIDTFKDCAK